MWITPSGIPRYNLHEEDLVKVNLETGKTIGRLKPSIHKLSLNIQNKEKNMMSKNESRSQLRLFIGMVLRSDYRQTFDS